MSIKSSRARLGAAVVVAFLCGLIFASGFDLTRFGWAQGRVNPSANRPTAAEVAPAADLESAFEAVADHARPGNYRASQGRAIERLPDPRCQAGRSKGPLLALQAADPEVAGLPLSGGPVEGLPLRIMAGRSGGCRSPAVRRARRSASSS